MITFSRVTAHGWAGTWDESEKSKPFGVRLALEGTGADSVEKVRAFVAAAPDLLKACEAALAYNDAARSAPGVGEFSWAAEMRAAIAKANGVA